MSENVTRHHVELAEVVRNLAVAGLFDADAFDHWSTPLPDPRHADVSEVAAVLAENDGADLVLVSGDPEFLPYLDAPALEVEAVARHLVHNGAAGHVADPVASGTGGLGTRWYHSEAVHRIGDPVPGSVSVIAAALHGDATLLVDKWSLAEALAAFVLWAWDGGEAEHVAGRCAELVAERFEARLVELPEIVDGIYGVAARYVKTACEGWAGDAETAAEFYGAESLAYGDGTDLELGDWLVDSDGGVEHVDRGGLMDAAVSRLVEVAFRRWEDDGCPGRRDPSSPDATDPEK